MAENDNNRPSAEEPAERQEEILNKEDAQTPPVTRRVKIYLLSPDGDWLDKGTGFLFLNFQDADLRPSKLQKPKTEDDVIDDEHMADANKTLWMTVIADAQWEEQNVLLHSEIDPNTNFQRQKQTLIVWYDSASGQDLAISFQVPDGCNDLWEKIVTFKKIRGSESLSDSNSEDGDQEDEVETNEEDDIDDDTVRLLMRQYIPDDYKSSELSNILPILTSSSFDSDYKPPEVLTAERLQEDLTKVKSGNPKFVSSWALMHKYPTQLVKLFVQYEPQHNDDFLSCIAEFATILLSLGNPLITELMFTKENIIPVLGIFEYVRSVPARSRVHLREFLEKNTKFQQVVPFQDSSFCDIIQHTFQLQYVRDTMGIVFLDDFTNAIIERMINTNLKTIRETLSSDKEYFTRLFSMFMSAANGSDTRVRIMKLLVEMMNMIRIKPWLMVPPDAAKGKDGSMCDAANSKDCIPLIILADGYRAMAEALNDSSAVVRYSAARVISMSLNKKPAFVRSVLMSSERQDLRDALVKAFQQDEDSNVIAEVAGVFNSLLAQNVLSVEDNMSLDLSDLLETISNLRYTECVSKFIPTVLGVFSQSKEFVENASKSNPRMDVTLELACELLIACSVLPQKYFFSIIEQCDPLHSVVVLLRKRRADQVVLSAIRLLRFLVYKTPFFSSDDIIQSGFLNEAMELFFKHRSHEDMMYSAILEMIKFLCCPKYEPLINNIMETFGDRIRPDPIFAGVVSFYDKTEDNGKDLRSDDEVTASLSDSSNKLSQNYSFHSKARLRPEDENEKERRKEEEYFESGDDYDEVYPATAVSDSGLLSLPPIAPHVDLENKETDKNSADDKHDILTKGGKKRTREEMEEDKNDLSKVFDLQECNDDDDDGTLSRNVSSKHPRVDGDSYGGSSDDKHAPVFHINGV